MDEELEMNREFVQHRQLKSFIRVGTTFIDIKQTIGFSFMKDPTGYLIVQFVYESGRAMNTFLRNRNDFAMFLMELDSFIDDPNALSSMNKFIDEIETELKIGINDTVIKQNRNKNRYYKKKYNKSNSSSKED